MTSDRSESAAGWGAMRLSAGMMSVWRKRSLSAWLAVICLMWPCLGVAQDLRLSFAPPEPVGWPLTGETAAGTGSAPAERLGSISGTVLDGSDAAVPGAVVTLTREGARQALRVESGDDGMFALAGVPAGTYRVRVERAGFVPYTTGALLGSGQRVELGEILLGAAATESVEVHASGRDIAEAQVALEEQQRVLGVFPNFYASYAPDAEPLSAGQKYRLAWRFTNDPVAFALAAVIAGGEQPHSFRGYGPGMTGYDKRFGAAYADGMVSTMVGQALLPAVLHQDPRYFVKGSGSLPSRVMYAVASTLMCKGDNKRWQVNYSNILGNAAGAGVSNLYYPSGSRRGMGAVAQVAMTSTALGAVGGLFQEFVLHRMTPHVPEYNPAR